MFRPLISSNGKPLPNGPADPDLVAGPQFVEGPGHLPHLPDREVEPVVFGAEGKRYGELPGPEYRAHDELAGLDPEIPPGFRVLERKVEGPDVLDLVLDFVDDGDLRDGDDRPRVWVVHRAPALVISLRM